MQARNLTDGAWATLLNGRVFYVTSLSDSDASGEVSIEYVAKAERVRGVLVAEVVEGKDFLKGHVEVLDPPTEAFDHTVKVEMPLALILEGGFFFYEGGTWKVLRNDAGIVTVAKVAHVGLTRDGRLVAIPGYQRTLAGRTVIKSMTITLGV